MNREIQIIIEEKQIIVKSNATRYYIPIDCESKITIIDSREKEEK